MALFLPLCLSVSGAEAQEGEDEREGQAPFRVEVDAVNILAAVHDNKTLKFVTDLTKEDFEIYEEGVLQTITNFTQQTDLPLTIALCVDTSSSVRLKLGFEKEAATDFLYSVMRPNDRAMLVEFDTGVTLIHDFTSNPNDLVREIKLLKAGGGTSLYDAVYLVAEQKMLSEPGRKTVIILSDGADLTSKHTFEEMLRMAYQAEVTVYAISTDFRWLYLACLTVFGSFFPVRIPSSFKRKTQPIVVTTSDVFIFTAILLFGPEVAVTIAAIDAGVATTVSLISKRPSRIAFNLAMLSLVTFAVGHIFYQLHGSSPPLNSSAVDLTSFFLPWGLCSILYFVLNSGAVATATALNFGQPIFVAWKRDFLWVSLTTFAGASAAALIFLFVKETPFFAIAVAAPIVLIIYYAYKINLERMSQAQTHVAQLNELYHSTVESLAMAIDAKDAKTHGHIQRVQSLTLRLAKYCGLSDGNELDGLRAASLMHDIGKLAISEYILNKPSALNKWERQKVRKHPTIGADILSQVPFP